MDPLTAVSTRRTAQSEQADPRQKRNAAGGYAFKLADESLIHRFLVLGTTGGTYYTSERDLTKVNADVVLAAARDRGEWLAYEVGALSNSGRAPRQNPAIFALAAVAGLGSDTARKVALGMLPVVCRTGYHLFLFATYVEQFRGWGRGLRRAVGAWYTAKSDSDLAYQVLKYRQREGWTHRDLFRLAHPVFEGPVTRNIAKFVLGRDVDLDEMFRPPLVDAFRAAQDTTDVAEWVRLVSEYPLSWEMLPDAALKEPKVWKALVDRGMPITALMRQLPRLTNLGVLEGSTLGAVVERLQNPEILRKGRVHPVNILVAARTYASGRSVKGSSTWAPKRQVIDALDAAFYSAFQVVEPTGKRTLLALDVSGSMTQSASGLSVSCREASAALALVTMATEPDVTVVGFTAGVHARRARLNVGGLSRESYPISELPISPRQRLDDVVNAISGLPFGGTDCSLPMLWAKDKGLSFDTIVIYTDNETWAGYSHPHQALREYRNASGIDTRLVVVGMTANDVSIADPSDPGMLDVAGFDSAVPNLISDFSRRSI